MNLHDVRATGIPAPATAPCLILPYAELKSQCSRYGALLPAIGLKPGACVAAPVQINRLREQFAP